MYTIAVELHGLRQLLRISPDLVRSVRRSLIAAIEVHGGSFLGEDADLWLFRFERARPEDRTGVQDALRQAVTIAKSKETELSGWTIFLDYVEIDLDIGRWIRDAMIKVSTENRAWVGPAAATLLEHFLSLTYEASVGLHEVVGDTATSDFGPESAQALAAYEPAADLILDSITTEEASSSFVLVEDPDEVASRANTIGALDRLQGSASVSWLEAEPFGSSLSPLCTLFSRIQVHETPFWLRPHEKESWEERVGLVNALMSRDFGSIFPDAFQTDILLALETYLTGYTRRAADATVIPVIVCERIDLWDEAAVDGLLHVVSRLPESEGGTSLVALATSAPTGADSRLRRIATQVIELPHRSIVEYGAASGAHVSWDRVSRITEGNPTAVSHYLAAAVHWDTRPESALDDVSPDDLAWQASLTFDSEVQELLLAINYASRFVNVDEFATMAQGLGTDAVRVPAVIDVLVSAGLLSKGDYLRPLHPELRDRFEVHLGDRAREIKLRVADHVVRAASNGSISHSGAIIDLVVSAGLDDDLPRQYHDLVTERLSRRDLAGGHRVLYDAVPPRGFQPTTRACMQTVVHASRLRLALLEENAQAAERIHLKSEREESECDFAEADLALQRSRFAATRGPVNETVALIKRSIVLYQQLDDQAGLARANLDFGLVKLANEDVLGAGEYFLLASKAAASSGDLFEQLRARHLTIVNSFVFGNLSRAMASSDELSDAAGDAGMRELQLFCDLTRGRALFELGRYEEAVDAFSRGRGWTRLYGFDAAERVMDRWIARSLIYDGRYRRGLTILRDQDETSESAFFLAEAHLRNGNHADSLQMLERGLGLDSDPAVPVERIGWYSGFSALEDRAIGLSRGVRVLRHQMLALRGYVLAESGRVADGVEEMHRLTRELRTSEIDPYNRIYFYLYSLILPESGEMNLEDGSTVLGKAVRYIQQRTSRMDEYAHKTDYLRRNYWNTRLMAHAQTHNLA